MTHTLYKMCSRVRRAVRTHRRAVAPMRLHKVYKVCADNLGCGDMGGEAGRAASMMPPSKQTGSFIETALPANGGFEITACDGAAERNIVYKVCAGDMGRVGCGEGSNDAATQSLITDCDLIRRAKTRVYLIDNYVNDAVLTMFDKRGKNVSARIYTGKCTKQLQLDLNRHNTQYPKIEIIPMPDIHDRFLIIDDVVYLVDASLKDAGKKKFAIIRMALSPDAILPKGAAK